MCQRRTHPIGVLCIGFLSGLLLALAPPTSARGAETAADCERAFAPRSGQAGKDVIWVPTPDELVTAMLDAAKVTAEDFVVDLGSGDGRIPVTAAKRYGARALGIEYNPQMVQLAQCIVRAEGLQDKVQIKQADIFETNFGNATVVTMYLLSDLNLRLRPTILAMRPGTRVVSNSFRMGDWEPDAEVNPANGYLQAYLWIVPADVSGQWTLEGGADNPSLNVRIEQKYQRLSASLLGQPGLTVRAARLRGAQIELDLVDTQNRAFTLKGTVDGNAMELAGRRGGQAVTYRGRRT